VDAVRAAFRRLFNGRLTERDLKMAADRVAARSFRAMAAQSNRTGTRFSFAGEQSIKNLSRERRKFMADSLDAAKAMAAAGKSREEIRAVTGWFPGFGKGNEKLRYEVPDTNAEFTKKGFGKSGKLDSVLIHPDLYEVYPDANDINLVWDPNLKASGIFEQDSNTIYINSSGANQLRTLLHELQHWIQLKEGFAFGSSPAQESSKSVRAKAVTDAQYNLQKAWYAIPADLRVDIKDNMREKLGYTNLTTSALDRNDELSLEYLDRWESALKLMPSPEFDQVKKAFRDLMEARDVAYEGKETYFDRYRRVAGEYEARDVQARLDLSDEQRKVTAPYSSENIAEEDAIVMFGSGGPQASMSMPSPEARRIDQEYMAAVEAGDTETAQRLVNEAAKAAAKPFSVKTQRKDFSTETAVSIGGKTVSVFRDPENGYWYFADKGGLGNFIATSKEKAIQAAVERIEDEQGGAEPSTTVQFSDWKKRIAGN
jgi:hypothetical protein